MYRLIVTSNTYRQASTVTPALQERDPANVLLHPRPAFPCRGGDGTRHRADCKRPVERQDGRPRGLPPQPPGMWSFPGFQDTDLYVESEGEDRHRRALYTFIRRTVRYPSMTVFDAPSHEVALVRRPRTNTPATGADRAERSGFFEAAQALARRIVAEGGAGTPSRATYGFRLVMSRKPNGLELEQVASAFEKETAVFPVQSGGSRKGLRARAMSFWRRGRSFSNALLNLDGTMTKE
jgi:hypothetical protein